MALSKDDWTKISEAMTRLNQERLEREAAAPEIVAFNIECDQPDGTFEILFMTRADAEAFKSGWGKDMPAREISFAEGVELARRPDCCGGSFALKDAKRIQAINPFVQGLKLNLG